MSESEEGAGCRKPTTLEDRLNRLIDVYHPPHRGPYSDKELSALISERGLGSVSHTYLKNMRTGVARNPSKDVLELLSQFFGVKPEFWFDDDVAATSVRDLERLALVRETGIEHVLLRLAGVSDEGMAIVLDVVEGVRKMQGLPSSK